MTRAPLIIVASLALAAGTAGAATDPAPAAVAPVRAGEIARVLVPVRATAVPGGGRVLMGLRPNTAVTEGPTQLRVTGRAESGGIEYLRVQLPLRPNGTLGWIPADAARRHRTAWSVRVDLRARTLRVLRGGRAVRTTRVVVGAPATPTPRGTFAITEIVPQRDPAGFYGPWVLTLTAHSDVLERFQGAPALVAIHGRGGGSLRDPLGTARSHGCVRIPSALVAWMARTLEPGVPVTIR